MNEDKTVGADAHIPSDTEPFEQNASMFRRSRPPTVTEQVRQRRDKIYESFNNSTKRMASYVQWHLQNNAKELEEIQIGPAILAVEAYTNLRIVMAQQEAMIEFMAAEHGIRFPRFDMLELANKKLEEMLKDWEGAYGIEIGPTGVKLIKRPEGVGNSNDGAPSVDNRDSTGETKSEA